MMNSCLRWRAQGDAEESWRLLAPAPAANKGFTELGSYFFSKPAAGWSLRIDDEPLSDGPGTVGHFSWRPGFFAGEVTAELVDPAGARSALFLLDVAPDPSKIGRELFAKMVDELWRDAPDLLIGTEPATTLVGNLGTLENVWLAFARLRRYGPQLAHAVTALQLNPRSALQVRRDSVPLHRVGRVDAGTVAALVRSPAFILCADDTDQKGAAEYRLEVPLVEETLDCAANRTLLALLLAVMRRAVAVLLRLQELTDRDEDSETRTALRTRWPVRRQVLERTIASLKRLSRRAPFSEVRRPEVTAAGLTAISADAVYARAWSRGWRAIRPGLAADESQDRLWVSPSWEIYERWCFIRLGRLLEASAAEWRWTRMADRWIGAFNGEHAELILQPTFRTRSSEVDGMWSISKERVPDFLLRVDSVTGTRFVLLDAKYRTARLNVLDAMESAHIYRDSLRIGLKRAEAALLLVPAGGGAPWLEESDFHERHRVGVFVVSPDGQLQIPALVRDVLSPRP